MKIIRDVNYIAVDNGTRVLLIIIIWWQCTRMRNRNNSTADADTACLLLWFIIIIVIILMCSARLCHYNDLMCDISRIPWMFFFCMNGKILIGPRSMNDFIRMRIFKLKITYDVNEIIYDIANWYIGKCAWLFTIFRLQ